MECGTNRLTTAEAARLLGCETAHALQLLKAANVPSTRMTKQGAYLWDAEGVERLVAVLRAKGSDGG